MHGERILFVMALPDGGVAHVATWLLQRGRRSLVEVTAVVVPADGPPRVGSCHYPGWALRSWQPDDASVALGFGPSEIVTEPGKALVDLHLSAPGLGFRVRFIGDTDPAVSPLPLCGGPSPTQSVLGVARGLCGVAGVQGAVDGRAAWEAGSRDTDALASAEATGGAESPGPARDDRTTAETVGFSRAWVFDDEIAWAAPTPDPATGGPLDFTGPLRKQLFNAETPRAVSGRLPGRLTLTIADRAWSVDSEPLLDLPLVGALPFSWALDRWWVARHEVPWRWRLGALRRSDGRRIGVCEQWVLPRGTSSPTDKVGPT